MTIKKEERVQPTPLHWAFTYQGPVMSADDRSCEMCNAVSMKRCPKSSAAHGANPSACTTCYAAKMGYCPNHGGIAKVFAEHAKDHDIHSDHQDCFDAVSEGIVSAIETMKGATHVDVKVNAHQDQPGEPFARVTIEIAAHKR